MMDNVFAYPDVKSVVICGDVHGEFRELAFRLCVRYGMSDTLLIVAGVTPRSACDQKIS